jgi:hypothetical protein
VDGKDDWLSESDVNGTFKRRARYMSSFSRENSTKDQSGMPKLKPRQATRGRHPVQENSGLDFNTRSRPVVQPETSF